MNEVKCSNNGCHQEATAHFVLVQNRRPAESKMLCKTHGRALISQYWPSNKLVKEFKALPSELEGIPFDIEALYSEKPEDNGMCRCEIYLLQTNGAFRLPIQTGLCELTALHRTISHASEMERSTHTIMGKLLTDLGGELDCVTLDKFYSQKKLYDSTLHIRQDNHALSIGGRPSDFITLAVIFNAPILALPEVLTSFGID